jgi:mannosyltransferase OCH1-like enzyme
MKEEYNSLLENQTWDMVPLPLDRKFVRCIWIYRTKKEIDGQVNKYKERLVSKGFQYIHEIDYDETFAPIAKMDSF